MMKVHVSNYMGKITCKVIKSNREKPGQENKMREEF